MWLQSNAPKGAGCIGFYQSHGSLIDKAIVARTGSDIVHVAIFDDGDVTIAATSPGITRQPCGNEAYIWTPASGYDNIRLNEALTWLHSQVGLPYGYADIANQVLTLFGKDLMLLDKSSDCSDLACKFLWIAGVFLPASLIETHLVTPGGLYTALSAIP